MKSRCLLFAAFAILVTLPFCVFGQKKGDDKEESQKWPIDIRLSLAVADASGNPVSEIKAEEIRLFENDVEQQLTYFERKPVSNIAFVIDNTRSMIGLLETEMAIAQAIVNNLNAGAESMVIRFVSREKIQIAQPTTSDRAKLTKAFDNLFLEGGQSAIRDAIFFSVERLREETKDKQDKRSAVILISDGEDRDSYYSEKQLFSLISGSGVQIHVIGLTQNLSAVSGPTFIRTFARARAEEFLTSLAVRTGGAVFFPRKKYDRKDVEAMVSGVVHELRSPFVIRFTSTNQNHDGLERKLRVEITDGPKGEKRIGSVRAGYIVPKM